MSDDKTRRGGQDRQRVNVNEAYELRDWSTKFGVTPEQLREAVKQVGDRAEALERHFRTARA